MTTPSSGGLIVSSSMFGTVPPLITNRYQASAPTRCRTVSRSEPYVPGTGLASWSAVSDAHTSISCTEAHT